MKILLAFISSVVSSLATLFSFCRRTQRPQHQRHVNSIVVASVLISFAHCFANDLTSAKTATTTTTTTTAKNYDNRKQWENDAITISPTPSSASVSSTKTIIAVDQQSPASKPSNLLWSPNFLSSHEAISDTQHTPLSFSKQFLSSTPPSFGQRAITKITRTTQAPPAAIGQSVSFSPELHYTSALHLFADNDDDDDDYYDNLKTARKKATTPQQSYRNDSRSSNNDVLVLIQSTKHIKLKLVRDQFQQFADTFGVKLQNITIDFDIIDGKCNTLVLPYTFVYTFVQSNFSCIKYNGSYDFSYTRSHSAVCDTF